MKTAMRPFRQAYTGYGELANINAPEQVAAASTQIVDALKAALAQVGAEPLSDSATTRVNAVTGLIGLIGAEAHARRLRALNEDYTATFERVSAWWKRDMGAAVDSVQSDFALFSVGSTPLACIAPLAQSEALPFTNEIVRRAMRREQMVTAEVAARNQQLAQFRAVDAALEALGRAHRALAQDTPSAGEALAQMSAGIDRLNQILGA
ncbi:MAG: hypothetical protein R3C16_05075 [Hyphomonadaceae bacterium]